MSLLDDIANGFRQIFGGGNNNHSPRPQNQPKPYTPQFNLNKQFGMDFNPSRDFSAPYQTNNDELERQERERKRQAEEARRREAERKRQEAERLNQIRQKKKPSFFDYLNPFGEHGLFGAKQQQNFKNTIKPVNDVLKGYEKLVDSSDKQAGFQWNDIGDYLRFAAKLPTSMASGVVNAPDKIGQAISGTRMSDKSEVEHLNLLQRGATALDAGLDIGGLGLGGSGTLLKGIFKKAGQETVEQAAKKGFKETAKQIIKDGLKEGAEEGVQTFLGDLSDDGKINTSADEYIQSTALGMLGGKMASAAGMSIGHAKQAYLQSSQAKLDSHVAQRMASDPKFAEAVAQRKQEIKQSILEAHQEVAQEQATKKQPSQPMQVDNEVKFKLANDEHGRYVEIERDADNQQQFNDLNRNELAKQARNVLNNQRANNPFDVSNGELIGTLSGQGNKEYTRSSVPLSPAEFESKMRLSPEIKDSLNIAEFYDSDNNKKNNSLAPDGFDYYDSKFKDNGRNFINRYNVAKNNKLNTNTIYGATTFPADENWQITELDNKKTPGTPSLVDKTTPLGSVPEVSSSNIAQTPENVNPEIKYKLSETANQVKSSIDELKARHFQLTGDNDIAFNAFAEAIQDIGNIEGYYDPKTNTVHIGELAEYVLNHEVVHKTLRKHLELRPEIMQATADKFGIDNIIDEYNQKGYGEQAVNGHTLDANQPKDVRLAVEEKVADEFNTYLDQYQKGRANYYANKVGLSPTIRAWFDRIIEGLKEFFGQADKIKQFYAQLETGKFANKQLFGNSEQLLSNSKQLAYKIDPETNIVHIDDEAKISPNTRVGDIGRIIRERIRRFVDQDFDLGNSGIQARITETTINEVSNKQQKMPYFSFIKKGEMSNNFNELLNTMENVRLESMIPSKANQTGKVNRNADYYIKGDVKVMIDGKLYTATIVNEVDKAGNVIAYDISRIRKSTGRGLSSSTISPNGLDQSINNPNIPQSDENIKYKLSDDVQIVSDFYYNDHQSAEELRQNLIDQLWQANKKGQGVDHIWHEAENALDDTYMVRASNNTPFYSGYWEANGKKPTKAGITAIVDEILGIENDYPAPTVTAQMREYIAHNLGDPEGIVDAYERLNQKRKVEEYNELSHKQTGEIEKYKLDNNYEPSDYDLELDDLIARATDLNYLEGAEYDALYRQLEKEKIALDKKYGKGGFQTRKVDYAKRQAKEKQMMDNIIAESNAIKQELSSEPTPIKRVIEDRQETFKNVPLENKNQAYTKGNLYEQTTIGSSDDVIRGGGAENGRRFVFGDWEMRQHTRKKNGKSFTQVERRYIDPKTGEPGEWRPYSKAAYLWHTQSEKIDQVNRDQLIQEALAVAKQDGEVREFVAKTTENGGTEVEPLLGNKTIDGGLVRDPVSGEVEGNYIQVTPFGVVNQVAGKLHLTELDQIAGKKSDTKAKPNPFDTYMRTVEKTAANEQSKQTQQDLYYKKTMAYAEFIKNKEEVLAGHTEQAGILDGYRPKGVKAKAFWEDVGRYTENTFPAIEGKSQQQAFAHKYGQEAAQAVEKYSQYMRKQYDNLIEQANAVRRMYGKDEIPHRKNYMPHMLKDGSLFGMTPAEVAANLRGEMETVGRGEIPANIAGLSENFKPTEKFNRHKMRRKRKDASDYELDPRKVFEKYTDLVLYNAHMEPVIAEGRQLEAAMRAADHESSREVLDPLSALKQGEAKVSSRQTLAVTNFVNAMAGKSNHLDRAWIDEMPEAMRALRRLENINGANKIMGNISSTFAQALNLKDTIRDNGVKNTARAILHAFNTETKAAMNKSAFLTERYADGGEKFSKTKWQKLSNRISKITGMDLVESAFIRLAWGANYQRLKSDGYKGFELIKRADQATERAVGGRGIGAMPQIYQSALGKTFLQFTYETNESFKNDIAHLKGVVKGLKAGDYKKAGAMTLKGAEALVTAMALNAIYKQITGNKPLPDLLGAAIKTGTNAAKDDDDETKENVIRNAVGNIGTELVKSNPATAAAVNLMPKSSRQQIFGRDSDFGRFDGATGVAQTMASAGEGMLNLWTGEYDKAAQNLTQVIPMGSQIRKTVGGADALLKGAVTKKDKHGDEQVVYEVDSKNPVNIVKGLAFGKNALNETQAYYQEKDSAKVKLTNNQPLKAIEKQHGKDSWQYIRLKEAMERRRLNKDNDGYKTSTRGVLDDMVVKLAKGDLIQDKPEAGGLLRTRDGNVAKEFYKKLAEAEGKPNVFKEYINSDEGMKFEYLEADRQYQKAMKEGSLSKKEQIKKRQELTKMQIQSDWRKEYRDAYSLTSSYQDTQSVYALYGDGKNEVRQKLNEINDAMFKAKLIDQKTYNKRYENINEIDKPKRGRGGGRSSDSFTVPRLPGYRITKAPEFQRATNKGKGIVKGLKLTKSGGVEVSPLPRARVTRR